MVLNGLYVVNELDIFCLYTIIVFTDSSESVDIDLHHVIPLRKQIGFLNMLQTILTRLSSSIQSHVDFLLNTLLDVLSTCQECLKKRDMVSKFVI